MDNLRDVALIFDLDGTLVDTVPDLAAAANVMLAALGQPPMPVPEVQSHVGRGVPKLVRGILAARRISEDATSDAIAHFLAAYNADPARLSRPYADVDAALRWAADAGATLAICTNKPLAPAQTLVAHFGWSALFAQIIGGDSLPEKKPDPRPLQHVIDHLSQPISIFIGDSEVDSATAKAATVPFCLFEGGYRRGAVDTLHKDQSFASYATFKAAIAPLI